MHIVALAACAFALEEVSSELLPLVLKLDFEAVPKYLEVPLRFQNDRLILSGEGFSQAITDVRIEQNNTSTPLEIFSLSSDEIILKGSQVLDLVVDSVINLLISSSYGDTQAFAVQLHPPQLGHPRFRGRGS